MKIPNGEHALIEREKVRDYLLNASHPDGFGKAAFFRALGFHPESWQTLADALRHLAQEAPVIQTMTSVHGIKYIIDGSLVTPSGRTAMVRTVWIVEKDGRGPRLVTAYPQEEVPS